MEALFRKLLILAHQKMDDYTVTGFLMRGRAWERVTGGLGVGLYCGREDTVMKVEG